jgi:hypothetical protein
LKPSHPRRSSHEHRWRRLRGLYGSIWVIRVKCGQPPVHSRPAAGLPVSWLGKYFPPYAPRPDAPSRACQVAASNSTALRRRVGRCVVQACARRMPRRVFADTASSNGSKTVVWSRRVLGSPWPERAGPAVRRSRSENQRPGKDAQMDRSCARTGRVLAGLLALHNRGCGPCRGARRVGDRIGGRGLPRMKAPRFRWFRAARDRTGVRSTTMFISWPTGVSTQ